MSQCERCGRCCMELGCSFWVRSGHPLISAIANRLPDEFYDNNGSCDMLEMNSNGRATCLLQKWLGYNAKPEACRQYPFDGELCFREMAEHGQTIS